MTAHADLAALHVTLTIRSIPGRPLADQWGDLRTVAHDKTFQKFLERNTEGVFWSDGVTVSTMDHVNTWNVHRHFLLAVTPDQAVKLRKNLASNWCRRAASHGIDASLTGQDVRPLRDTADVWPVAAYISDQFALHHEAGPGALSPGQLLMRATTDETYSDIKAFVTIERAMPQQTIRASGIFARAHVAELRSIDA